MKKIFLGLFAAVVLISSCSKKQDPAPTTTSTSTTSTTTTVDNTRPTPCFIIPTTFELINGLTDEITFSAGCSEHSYFYDWDFGDGSPHETDKDVKHIYRKTGKFTVTLKVWNQGKTVSDSKTSNITVGERYLTKITINSIDPIDPITGMAWDHSASNGASDTLGPDLFLQMGLDSDIVYLFSTDTMDVVQVYDNVITDALGTIKNGPVTWDFSKSTSPLFKNIKLTSYKWVLQIMDKTYASGGGGGSRSLGSTISFNPVITFGSKSPASYPLSGKYKLTFEWVIR